MIKPYNKGRISYGNFKHHKNFVTSGKEQAKMNYRNWWDLGKWMLIQIVYVCKTAVRIFISKKSGCWTALEKCYSFYIFPYTKVFDNLGQNDNQYHKEEAVSCQ